MYMPKSKITKTKEMKPAKSKIVADIYDLEGQVIEKVDLSPQVFGKKVNSNLLTQIVRIHQANKRAGTHSTKTRTEITGSTRKIYRQKGTGRARHGDIKAPIFVGGGVAHGPKPRDYSMDLPKKMKKLALVGALTGKLEQGLCIFVKGLEKITPKTKIIYEMLKNLKILSKKDKLSKNIMLVMPDVFKNILLAGRNIQNLNITTVARLNAYDVLINQKVIFMKDSVKVLEEKITKEIDKDKKPQETKTVAPISKAIKPEKSVKKATVKKIKVQKTIRKVKKT